MRGRVESVVHRSVRGRCCFNWSGHCCEAPHQPSRTTHHSIDKWCRCRERFQHGPKLLCVGWQKGNHKGSANDIILRLSFKLCTVKGRSWCTPSRRLRDELSVILTSLSSLTISSWQPYYIDQLYRGDLLSQVLCFQHL